MRKTFSLFAIAMLVAAAYSCGKCFVEDCPGNGIKLIRFYAAVDSTDLITSGRFKLDSLDITALKQSANGEEPGYEITFSNPYTIAIQASENAAGFVFKLDSLPPDTLLVNIGATGKSKCCNSVSTFESVTLNGNQLDQGPEDLTINIFK